MPFEALVANLKPTSGDHMHERGSVMDVMASPMALYELLSALDPDLMSTLWCSLERGLLTLALLKKGCGALSSRVTALAEEGLSSMSALLQAIACSPVLTWQRGQWALEATDMTQSRWAGISDWADFMAQPKGRTLTFHLGTPLVLPSQTEGDGGSIAHFPHPRPVFEMLQRKWQEFDGPALPSDVLSLCDHGGCVVSDYRLRSSRIALPDGDHQGFLGWIAYQCRSDGLVSHKTNVAIRGTRYAVLLSYIGAARFLRTMTVKGDLVMFFVPMASSISLSAETCLPLLAPANYTPEQALILQWLEYVLQSEGQAQWRGIAFQEVQRQGAQQSIPRERGSLDLSWCADIQPSTLKSLFGAWRRLLSSERERHPYDTDHLLDSLRTRSAKVWADHLYDVAQCVHHKSGTELHAYVHALGRIERRGPDAHEDDGPLR